jgi:leader peptidase (prepilin peptidase)/N-methyltransferase
MFAELNEVMAATPALVAGVVFVLSLLVGSFLNVVIHRLPIMLDREWKAQAREMLAEVPSPQPSPAECGRGSEEPSPGLRCTSPADAGEVQEQELEPSSALRATSPASAEEVEEQEPSPGLRPTSPAEPGEVQDERYNLLVPRSRCPHCNVEIKAHQNIPVLSYLLLGGKCANCGTRISPRYPIVELVTALLSTAVALKFGWHWQTIAALVFTWSLIALTVLDLDHTILPDVITLPLLWLGLLASLAWHNGLTPPAPVDTHSAVVGAIAGYLSLWSVYWAFKLLTGKEGMGYGDFKLFGALGAWLGWQMLPLVLLFSAFTGAIVGIALIVVRGRDRNVPMPFGPYLAAAGWIALMWGPQIMLTYIDP